MALVGSVSRSHLLDRVMTGKAIGCLRQLLGAEDIPEEKGIS
ncbi:hypothetical protein COLO4_18655 [Corchorus olitorius]|uniref:Uncharacterized protein n=1 Tax=Corchorus olitorius TaxID=93759 RepID=A0A1R3J8D7_9ROSI|nr:hypothetical protein COLO4_18655 [Corchorus olitorius]